MQKYQKWYNNCLLSPLSVSKESLLSINFQAFLKKAECSGNPLSLIDN